MKKMTVFLLGVVAALTLQGCSESVAPKVEKVAKDSKGIDEIVLIPDSTKTNPYNDYHGYPTGSTQRLETRNLGAEYEVVFNDSNYIQLRSARKIGMTPVNDAYDIWHGARPLHKVESNKDFFVEYLTHSHAYLVPEAEELLHEIGRNFRDSLKARGGGDYRIKVTSLLRTNSSVKSLQTQNKNAVSGSTHTYGTTFDISYQQFVCDGGATGRSFEDLKRMLAEVLADLQVKGKCYVKYELQQTCFHITVRCPDNKNT